jgi:hypothetical protein
VNLPLKIFSKALFLTEDATTVFLTVNFKGDSLFSTFPVALPPFFIKERDFVTKA